MRVVTGPQQGLRDVVAVRHWRRQLRCLIEQYRLQFLAQQVQGNVVHDQVMEQQDRDDTPVFRVIGMNQTQQRCTHELERLGSIQRRQRHLDHRQIGMSPDHLHRRFQAFPAQ
ncbi:hypothetical protein ALQ37_200146 [Pseudomonas syringae pv. aptata]|uniref:Uncharacterized protein n=1 Tax=Pseudomonas syringae pv. aptata TaxID=83167 RepID=A0A3M3WBY5_PSEAP|nr:hypothetical protein ALQ37_200146 [Pseudomonas syringae pv. aptata]